MDIKKLYQRKVITEDEKMKVAIVQIIFFAGLLVHGQISVAATQGQIAQGNQLIADIKSGALSADAARQKAQKMAPYISSYQREAVEAIAEQKGIHDIFNPAPAVIATTAPITIAPVTAAASVIAEMPKSVIAENIQEQAAPMPPAPSVLVRPVQPGRPVEIEEELSLEQRERENLVAKFVLSLGSMSLADIQGTISGFRNKQANTFTNQDQKLLPGVLMISDYIDALQAAKKSDNPSLSEKNIQNALSSCIQSGPCQPMFTGLTQNPELIQLRADVLTRLSKLPKQQEPAQQFTPAPAPSKQVAKSNADIESLVGTLQTITLDNLDKELKAILSSSNVEGGIPSPKNQYLYECLRTALQIWSEFSKVSNKDAHIMSATKLEKFVLKLNVDSTCRQVYDNLIKNDEFAKLRGKVAKDFPLEQPKSLLEELRKPRTLNPVESRVLKPVEGPVNPKTALRAEIGNAPALKQVGIEGLVKTIDDLYTDLINRSIAENDIPTLKATLASINEKLSIVPKNGIALSEQLTEETKTKLKALKEASEKSLRPVIPVKTVIPEDLIRKMLDLYTELQDANQLQRKLGKRASRGTWDAFIKNLPENKKSFFIEKEKGKIVSSDEWDAFNKRLTENQKSLDRAKKEDSEEKKGVLQKAVKKFEKEFREKGFRMADLLQELQDASSKLLDDILDVYNIYREPEL